MNTSWQVFDMQEPHMWFYPRKAYADDLGCNCSL